MNDNLKRFEELMGKEWVTALSPLLASEYGTDILKVIDYYYVNNDHHYLTYPAKVKNVFMSLLLTKPEDIHTIILNDSPAYHLSSNGVFYGTSTGTSHTMGDLQDSIRKAYNDEKAVIDFTCISYLKQGVLFLNHNPFHLSHGESAVGIFEYLYRNIISVVDHLSNSTVFLAGMSIKTNEAIKKYDVPGSLEVIDDAHILRIGKPEDLLMVKLDKIHEQYGQEKIKWYTTSSTRY